MGEGRKYHGSPCRRGHAGLRYVNGNACVACMREKHIRICEEVVCVICSRPLSLGGHHRITCSAECSIERERSRRIENKRKRRQLMGIKVRPLVGSAEYMESQQRAKERDRERRRLANKRRRQRDKILVRAAKNILKGLMLP